MVPWGTGFVILWSGRGLSAGQEKPQLEGLLSFHSLGYSIAGEHFSADALSCPHLLFLEVSLF